MNKLVLKLAAFMLIAVFLVGCGAQNETSQSVASQDGSSSTSSEDYMPPIQEPKYQPLYWYQSFQELKNALAAKGTDEIIGKAPGYYEYQYDFKNGTSPDHKYYGYLSARGDVNDIISNSAVAGARRKTMESFLKEHLYFPKYNGESLEAYEIDEGLNVLLQLNDFDTCGSVVGSHSLYATMECIVKFPYTSKTQREPYESLVYFRLTYTPDFDIWNDCYLKMVSDKDNLRSVRINSNDKSSSLIFYDTYEINGKTYEYLCSDTSIHIAGEEDGNAVPVYFIKIDDNTVAEIDFNIQKQDTIFSVDIEPQYSPYLWKDYTSAYGHGSIIPSGSPSPGFSFERLEF